MLNTYLKIQNIDNKKFLNNNATNNGTDNDRVSWFLLPYIDSMLEKFSSICKDTDIKLAFFSDNKLNRFIKVQKNAFLKFDNKNDLYDLL